MLDVLLRAEGFSCSVDVLWGGLGIIKLHFFKDLVAVATLFIYFVFNNHIHHNNIRTIHSIHRGFCFLHCFRSAGTTSLGCRAGIWTRACRIAGQRATNWAMLHPKLSYAAIFHQKTKYFSSCKLFLIFGQPKFLIWILIHIELTCWMQICHLCRGSGSVWIHLALDSEHSKSDKNWLLSGSNPNATD